MLWLFSFFETKSNSNCALADSGDVATLDKLARRRQAWKGEMLSAGEIFLLFFLFYPNLT